MYKQLRVWDNMQILQLVVHKLLPYYPSIDESEGDNENGGGDMQEDGDDDETP